MPGLSREITIGKWNESCHNDEMYFFYAGWSAECGIVGAASTFGGSRRPRPRWPPDEPGAQMMRGPNFRLHLEPVRLSEQHGEYRAHVITRAGCSGADVEQFGCRPRLAGLSAVHGDGYDMRLEGKYDR